MLKRKLAAIAAAAAVCAVCAVAAPGSALAQDPILFVHGWASSASTWDTMVERFEADGWSSSELSAYSYNTSQSNKVDAEIVAERVEELLAATEAEKVDIIAHSMGSLNSRWYLKFIEGGQESVDEWVSLGGPNHGTTTAYFCFSTACSEMRPGSTFLEELNAGDETPGSVNYGTWWSPCDSIVNPDSSVPLEGATNTETECISHSALHEDEAVYDEVREFVE